MLCQTLKIFIRFFLLTFILSALFFINAKAQSISLPKDTLVLTLDNAENIFQRNSLLVLAQRYNVDAQKALIIQAKLFPNPNIFYSHGPVIPLTFNDANGDPQPTNFFKESEHSAQLSQLILLAGKRNKQIKIAEANVKLAEYQVYEIIRTLKHTLRSDFYNIYFLNQSSKVYDKEIQSLKRVVAAFKEQAGKGYISDKEVIRVSAQLFNLQNEFATLISQINDVESELRTVLLLKEVYIKPQIDSEKVSKFSASQYTLTTLVDSALANRTDLLLAKATTEVSQNIYNYQKALATPDITLSLGFDKKGSYAANFNSVGASIDIPIFNRNQGNIQSAKLMIDVNQTAQKNTEAQMREQIYRSLQKLNDNEKLYQNIDEKFLAQFGRLLNEVFLNYEKRNIGLLDFLDFYDSYKQNTLQINTVRYNRLQSFEDINFYTGTSLF